MHRGAKIVWRNMTITATDEDQELIDYDELYSGY